MNVPTRAKFIAGEILCHPLMGSAIKWLFQNRVPSRGSVFDVNNKHIPPDNSARLFWGLYERNEIVHLRKFLRSDLDVLEFGTGIGAVSLQIIKTQEKSRKLICVEPNPFLIETLAKNIRFNAPWKQVEILNRALDYSGRDQVDLSVYKNNLGSEVRNENIGERVSVKATTLGSLVSEYKVGEFALVSDAEGSEVGMILKDVQALSYCRQMIIELHPAVFEGKTYTVESLRERIESDHGFSRVACRHRVYVFEKS